jgi:hypothetical protein
MANHASQSTAGNRPTRASGGGLNFNRADPDFLQLANAGATYLPTGTSDATYFTVSQATYSGVAQPDLTIFGYGGPVNALEASTYRYLYDRYSNGSIIGAKLGVGQVVTTNSVLPNPPSVTSLHIMSVTVANIVGSLWINGLIASGQTD